MKLLKTLLEFDHMSLDTMPSYCDNVIVIRYRMYTINWNSPVDRRIRRKLDTANIEKLLDHGYLEVQTDGQDHYIRTTTRGHTIVKLYRGMNAFNWMDYRDHDYLQWFNNAKRYQRGS